MNENETLSRFFFRNFDKMIFPQFDIKENDL